MEENILELCGSGDSGVEPLAIDACELQVEDREAFTQRGPLEAVAGPAVAAGEVLADGVNGDQRGVDQR